MSETLPKAPLASPRRETHLIALRRLTALLVQALDLREGCWQLVVEWGPNRSMTVNIPGADQAPGNLTTLHRVGLVRVPDDTPLSPLVVDAQVVNPRRVIAH